MKRSLLDTDTLSFYLKGVTSVVGRVREYLAHFERLEFSVITYYEIRRGLLHAGASRKVRDFDMLAEMSNVRYLDEAAARVASEFCAHLWQEGLPLDDADILIASIAVSSGLVLVTNNQSHFRRLTGLQVDNWLDVGREGQAGRV